MKKQFQSKSVPRGTRTIWRYLGALFLLFTLGIGQMWGAYDVPADGTVTLSQKVNNGGRFNVEASGVYHFRTSSGYSWDSSNGIKTQSNQGGVVFYLDESKEIEVGIVHTESANAHTVTVHVYSITKAVYEQFDNNKAGASESNRTFSTVPTSSTDGSFDISVTAETKTFTGKKTLAAGYYSIVPTGSKSKTFFKTIKFTTTGGETPVCPSGISITGDAEYTEGETISLTATKTAGNGEITYTWYKGADLATAKAAGALGTGVTYTKSNCVIGDAGKYFCEATKTSCGAAASSGFDVTVAADPKCFNMPEITSKPSDLAHVTVSGGTLSDVSTAKSVAMNANGLKLDGNNVYLKVTLASASIVEGTKITVAWKGASSGAGLALVNENLASQVINETNVASAGSVSHTFTAEEAANYADEFILHRNGSGQGIYVNAITVEDCGPAVTKHTITLNYNDGVTPNGSLKVVDGKAATQPTDPTRGKYTFLGWNKGSSAYNWSAAVTEDFTLVAQWQDPWTIMFDVDGGSAVADITVKHNTAADKPTDPTKDDNDFLGWFNGENAYDWTAVVTGNLNLKAHWAPIVAKYDVEYYDGETKIGTEAQVWANQHPTASGINTNKPLYTFVGWYTSSTLEGDPVALNTVTPVEGLKLYGKWTKAYATSYDMEAYAVSDGATLETLLSNLDAAGYAYTNVNGIDYGHTHNYIYDGMKYKTNDGDLSFNVNAGKLVIVKTGNLPANALTMYINGVADPTVFVGANEAVETHVNNYFYSEAEALYRLDIQASKGTCAIKAVTITDPYEVSFNANGGEDVASLNGTPSVTLPSASKGTDSFLGWFIGEDKIGEAGDSYTPTADVELVAHWEAVSTDTRIKALTYAIGAGTPVNIYEADKNTFNVVLPYAKSYDAITVATTPNHENASIKAGAVMTVSSLPGSATFTIVAQSGAEEDYTVNFSLGPKDGVSIIKATTNNVVTGLIGGTIDQSYSGTSDSRKLNKNNYFGVTLANSETFQEGDVMIVNITAAADLGKFMVYADAARTQLVADQGIVYTKADPSSTGEMSITLPAAANGKTSLYLSREDGDTQWNVTFSYIEVKRPMMPMLTAITINGVDCEKGTGNAYSVTLPEATTDLAALTVVPTIVWNAAATENSIVVNNGAAWQEGANTYKLTDKDGDATTYTITITLQGEAPAPVIATQPAGVAYCAGSEPTLTVAATGNELHYAWFKEAGETDEAVGTDAASYTVEAAGTYYVIVTNHVDGKLDKSVTSDNAVVTLNVAAAITTQPTNKRDIVSGATVTLSVEATNATGYQWYICDDAEKANASAISGADAANYVFNCSANAFYYCVVGNACGTDIESNVVSVKLEPVGCNVLDGTIPSAAPYIYDNGEWTLYAVTSGGKLDGTSRFDDDAEDFDGNTVNAITYGRVGMTFAKDVESLTIYATSSSSDRAISSIKVTTDDVTTGTPSYSDVTFTASAEKLGKKDSSSPYRFVLEANEMLLEAGKKYWLQFSGTVSAFKICYTTALAMPKLPTLGNQELCAGAAYETFNATITNATACEGTVSYKWYSTNDTENPVAETAEFTPTAEGTYYVVVTHAKAGHITRTAQSANLSVAHFDALTLVSHSEDVFQHMGTAATLSVVATGKNVAYVWYTCSNAAGDDAVAITPAETEAELTIASILEGVHYYKVVISHDCDATTLSHVFKVEGWDQLEQVDVTESTVWDMNNVSASEINLASMTPSKQNVLLLLANIEGVNNNASFNSQALMFEGQRIGRTENNVKYVSGQYVQFNVTVPGMVSVTFASNGSAQRTILINGKQCSRTTNDGTYITYNVAVEPGSVEIEDVQGYVRISKIEFKAEDNYHRTVNPSFLGTLCWTNNAVLGGATLYEFAGKDEYNKLVFDEVAENRLEAGKPYIFMPENGNTEIKLYNTDTEAALTEDQEPVNHMYGTITGKTLVPGQDDNMYYFSSNHIWAVKDFVVNIAVPAYYCYVDYPAVLADQPAPAAPAPGRRRVTMGVQGEQVVTGVENLNASEQPVKLLINGQIFILRGEKMFDATGRLVK